MAHHGVVDLVERFSLFEKHPAVPAYLRPFSNSRRTRCSGSSLRAAA